MDNPSFVRAPMRVTKRDQGNQVRRFASLKIRVACVEQGFDLLVWRKKFDATK
jgi:hypothetical protein